MRIVGISWTSVTTWCKYLQLGNQLGTGPSLPSQDDLQVQPKSNRICNTCCHDATREHVAHGWPPTGTPVIRCMFLACAVAALPCETVLLPLLQDNWLLRRTAMIRGKINKLALTCCSCLHLYGGVLPFIVGTDFTASKVERLAKVSMVTSTHHRARNIGRDMAGWLRGWFPGFCAGGLSGCLGGVSVAWWLADWMASVGWFCQVGWLLVWLAGLPEWLLDWRVA